MNEQETALNEMVMGLGRDLLLGLKLIARETGRDVTLTLKSDGSDDVDISFRAASKAETLN